MQISFEIYSNNQLNILHLKNIPQSSSNEIPYHLILASRRSLDSQPTTIHLPARLHLPS